MSLQHTDEVLFETINNAGIITLNRPKALNALNMPILTSLLNKLWEWEQNKHLVIIKGSGKAFCAGGDIKAVAKIGGSQDFTFIEYNVNSLIGNYKIPYIALIDGITMGAGMGLSVHGTYTIATENTIIAMPEAKIGLIPDVGGTYFLPRLPFQMGIYLGLTCNVVTGKDVVALGLATHFVFSSHLIKLEEQLLICTNNAQVKATLDKFQEPVGEVSLKPHLKNIDYCFSAPTVEEIIKRLRLIDNEWSDKTIKSILQMCPVSLKLTLKALNYGAQLNLWQCLQMEHRLIARLSSSYNFQEGVRALLKDRDNNPHWQPKTLEEVNDCDLEPYFEQLSENLELKVMMSKKKNASQCKI